MRAEAARFDPGGNGINIGHALKRQHTPAQSYCVTGGQLGQLLKRLVAAQLDDVDYAEVDSETRINGTFIERHRSPQRQYEVSGIGLDISPSQLHTLLKRFVSRAGGDAACTAPRSIPCSLYATTAVDFLVFHQPGV